MYEGPGIYRHYKGGEYEVLGLALQENTVTKLSPQGRVEQFGEGREEITFVVYRPLTPGSMLEDRDEDLWARELANFNGFVPGASRSTARFVKIDSRRPSNYEAIRDVEAAIQRAKRHPDLTMGGLRSASWASELIREQFPDAFKEDHEAG